MVPLFRVAGQRAAETGRVAWFLVWGTNERSGGALCFSSVYNLQHIVKLAAHRSRMNVSYGLVLDDEE